MNEITQDVELRGWRLSRSSVFSMFIQIALHSSLWLISVSPRVSIIRSSIDGHLGRFHRLALVNNDAVNICAHIFLHRHLFRLSGGHT